MATVRAIRENLSLSVRRLSAIAGVSHAVIYNVESGKHKPICRTIRKLAAALGVKPTDITFNKTDRPKYCKTKRASTSKEKGFPSNPLKLRFMVLSRDNFRCHYCGRDSSETKLHVDHILPKSKGGKDELSNYITSCKECNLGKHDVLLLMMQKTRRGKTIISDTKGQIPSFVAFS